MRDELQTEMIIEHNISYRMLERDRWTLEPPGTILTFWHDFSHLLTLLPTAHHIPTVPHKVPLAPTLCQIVDNVNTLYPGNHTTPTTHDQACLLHQTLLPVYPKFSTLSSNDIKSDLQYFHYAPFDN